METNKFEARFISATSPSKEEETRLLSFLEAKYGKDIKLVYEKEESIKQGFILKIGNEVYDNTPSGLIKSLHSRLDSLPKDSENYISLLKESLSSWKAKIDPYEEGCVSSVSDGIAIVSGLTKVKYGEIIVFETGEKGLVLNLEKDKIGCILFDDSSIYSGEKAYKTGMVAAMPVSSEIIGRVINPLGEPIDGKGSFKIDRFMPIESPAPSIIERSPVKRPLKTGILTIDSMFPIGKGQRELIIGDRQTGKTSIAIDTILNQKGKDVICIYCAIGQKSSTVKRLVRTLEEKGALSYSIVVVSSASDSSSLQYIAPFSACAIGEYFMKSGKDVLIVYDDLSKHAVAYRTLSLLLDRSPGREAYPGDIFYLHSRLLERSAQLGESSGGGSMSSLPIVETLSGDISSYIPTNVISITDGQLFLENEMFLSGQRPAINVGLSVSRVGGSAQTKAMKKAVGDLRLELAQYREMKTFTQFSSDIDDTLKRQLDFGRALSEILIQPLEKPYEEWEEVVILLVSLNKVTSSMEVKEIHPFFASFLPYFKSNHASIISNIETKKELSKEDISAIIEAAKSFAGANNVKDD